MQDIKEISSYVLDSLKKHGFTVAECYIEHKETTEANYFEGDVSLLRSFPTDIMNLKGLIGKKSGKATIATLDKASIDSAIEDCANEIKTSHEDKFEGISTGKESRAFKKGNENADIDNLLKTLVEYAENDEAKKFSDSEDSYTMKHIFKNEVYLNSNGVDLSSKLGYYEGHACFTNDIISGFSTLGKYKLPFDENLRNNPKIPLKEGFNGTIIFTPKYLRLYWWLSFISLFESNKTLGIEGNEKHKWADKINEHVASSCFTLSNKPKEASFCNACPFTRDGYVLEDTDIIKDGILKNLLYTNGNYARRAKGKVNINSVNDDGYSLITSNIYINPGEKSINDIIAGIDKGILAFSIPGAVPNNKEGNFSGIIRNGMLIENGNIVGPLNDVMATGNYYDMQQNIRGISKEYMNTGGDLAPWIAYDGVNFK